MLLRRHFVFFILVICCCGIALAFVNRGVPRIIQTRRISAAMSFSQQDRFSQSRQLRKVNQKSASNILQSTTLGKVSTSNDDTSASSSSSRNSNRRISSGVSSDGDDSLSWGPRRALKTTAPSTDRGGHAHELKITVGPDTTASSSSFCYFEKHHPCAGATRTGVCPVDGRPCGSNRNYIDHLYTSKQQPSAQYLGGQGGPHLSDRTAMNMRPRGSTPSQQNYYNSANPSQSKGASSQEVNRLVDDRRRQQRQQHLSAYFSQDPLEEVIPLPTIPTEYPARFIYDIVDTFKVAMHVGKLVVSIVVAMLSDTVNKNFRFYQHGPDSMDSHGHSNDK
jgi:hypothetical protein